MKVFVIDVELCVGCYACQFVCKDEHVGNGLVTHRQATARYWASSG